MSFFDGKHKTTPKINLSGSSRQKNRDELLKQANLDRIKRETEKLRTDSARTIQSFYKSYVIRRNIKQNFRNKFDSLIKESNDFKLILSYFVQFYNSKSTPDKDRLIKLSDLISKNKQELIKSIYSTKNSFYLDSFSLTFAKFLVFQLRLLNKSSELSPSVILRLIEYFTDKKTHAEYRNTENDSNKVSSLMFNFLIKNDYIKELKNFAISRIPSSVMNQSNIPIASSIAELIYRCFGFLKLSSSDATIDEKHNKNIINALCDQLFVEINQPQVKYLMNTLSQLISKNQSNEDLNYLVEFLISYKNMLEKEEYEEQQAQLQRNDDKLIMNNLNQNDTIKNKYIFKIYSIFKIYTHLINKFNNEQFNDYLKILRLLIMKVIIINKDIKVDDDYDNETKMQTESENDIDVYLDELFKMFESKQFSSKIETFLLQFNKITSDSNGNTTLSPSASSSSLFDGEKEEMLNQFCLSISYICDFVLINSDLKPHKSMLLKTLAFNRFFLVMLWKIVGLLTLKQYPTSNQELYLIQMLASGSCPDIYTNQLCKLVAPLSTFCSLYSLFLLPILDEEFLRGQAIFSKSELIQISSILKNVCIGIVNLMHPDTSYILTTTSSSISTSVFLTQKSNNKFHFANNGLEKQKELMIKDTKLKARYFTHLFHVCTQLVQRMHTRDIRYGFCPEDHWISRSQYVSSQRLMTLFQTQDASILTRIKFGQMSYLFQDEDDNSGEMMEFKFNLNDIRSMTILQELPFTIPFTERVKILENFIGNDFTNVQISSYRARIRRDYLYEDAFDNLSLENTPSLKTSRIIIEMINRHGLDEAGIDGGGLFREFIIQVLETGFDPTRGFFVLTSDGQLYPNPNVKIIVENYEQHYFFLGRMLAKAIQCKILSQLKFAGFFLQKILSKYVDTRLDIDYLASLDPEIYRNLISLKDYNSNVEDLELNFAINSNQFGQTETVELKPGGKDILVTNDNKIEYIHLLADYKLNKQINEQVKAFRNGISNIINLDLLRLFNFNELQSLISGPNDSIDVDDWKRNTIYAGLYNPEHSVIVNFWNIVESFTEDQKRKLLKFATSRSKPPLFGFQNLIPNFAIHSSGDQERLPSASTCLNLLKLPPIEDIHTLREKLICAIESDAGFELS